MSSTQFYDGHDPEAVLDGYPAQGYAAAVENAFPNEFAFAVSSPMSPGRLEIGWNSASEYGVDFKLFGIRDD